MKLKDKIYAGNDSEEEQAYRARGMDKIATPCWE